MATNNNIAEVESTPYDRLTDATGLHVVVFKQNRAGRAAALEEKHLVRSAAVGVKARLTL